MGRGWEGVENMDLGFEIYLGGLVVIGMWFFGSLEGPRFSPALVVAGVWTLMCWMGGFLA